MSRFVKLKRFWAQRASLVLSAACLLAPAAAMSQLSGPTATPGDAPVGLPLLGDISDMPSAAERRLGDRIARELFRDPDYLDDPVLLDYVQGIWQPLLAAARLRGDLTPELDERFAWQILLGRDRSVNAFALPGGYLGVHLGLLAVVSSRDELASVLGHELSHVTQRHISRLMSRNSQQAPWLMGAMILGALAASKSADAGNAMIVGGQALSAQGQLNFSRDMEREADRLGYGVMTQAGFEPAGFVTMFDKLQQASRLNDTGAYPYLRSHPLTTERIADMQSRLPLDFVAQGAPQGASPLHAMMAARARLLANADADSLRGWQALANEPALTTRSPAQQAGVWYGAALAASRLRDDAQARRHLQRLKTLAATYAEMAQPVRWLEAELALAAGAPSGAELQTLSAAIATGAGQTRRPELLLQAQIAIQLGQAERLQELAQRLQLWVSAQARDGLAWQWLARVYAAQHQSLRALRAEAEVQVAYLNYGAALDRLRAAQDQVRATASAQTNAQYIDASIIDTRRRQIEALAKEQALER